MSHASSNFLFFLLITTIVASTGPTLVLGISKKMAHIHVYMHDKLQGPNATGYVAVKGTKPSPNIPSLKFGEIVVLDDILTEGPNLSSAHMGRGHGSYTITTLDKTNLMLVMTFVLTTGEYNGSSIVIMGDDDASVAVRELPVIGGTGQFRMARGFVIWKTLSANTTSSYAVLELDIYATKTEAY